MSKRKARCRRWRRVAACSAWRWCSHRLASARPGGRRLTMRIAADEPCEATPARSAAAGLVADNALAPCMPLIEALASRCTGDTAADARRAHCIEHPGEPGVNAKLRRGHPRRRARGAHAGNSAAATVRRAADSGDRAPQPSGAAGRAQGRRILGRDRRSLLRHGARTERASQPTAAEQVRLPLFLQRRPQRSSTRSPSSARAAISRRRAISWTAASSRTSSASTRARSACSSSTAQSCAASTSARTARRIACASHRRRRAAKSSAAG